MQHTLLALATLTLTGSALAQCGSNQLTTPPNFTLNGGGATGGMMYFTLDVTAGNGVRICGIDINTSVNGTSIEGLVYRHRTVTDWNLLTGANNTVADWDAIACVIGTGMGDNNPSPMSVFNGTGTIDLAFGQHLLGVGNGNFNHRYTNGNGSNQNVADPDLTFDSGRAANVAFTGTLFTPRVFNATFDYDVPGAPVTTSPGGWSCVPASCVSVGSGCGGAGAPAHVYQQFSAGTPFDLNSTGSVRFSGNGTGISSLPFPVNPITNPISPDLGLGDDDNSPLLPLGFNLAAFGLPCVDAISISSNGYLWLGSLGAADPSESAAEFHAEGARLAVLWDDFKPAAGGGSGTIHFETGPNGRLIVTWLGVAYAGGGPAVTFQCLLTPTNILCVYSAGSTFNNAGLVGFANGFAQAVTPNSDLNAGPVGPFASNGVGDLQLNCVQAPIIGGGLTVTLENVPSGGIGSVLANFLPTGTAQPLAPPLFAANCNQYIQTPYAVLGLVVNGDPCVSYPFTIPVPPDPVWLGLPCATQGTALDTATATFRASNALDAVIGAY